MPTTLTLMYKSYIDVRVPNAIARKLKERQGNCVQPVIIGDDNLPFVFGNKWGKLFFNGADGKEYVIEGEEPCEIDYKRAY